MPLPPLREELDLMPGPAMPDGQPSWTLHDPARNQFFRIDWPTLEILTRWSMDDPEKIAADISEHTTLTLTTDDVLQVAQFVVQHQLVQATQPDVPRKMAEQLAAGGPRVGVEPGAGVERAQPDEDGGGLGVRWGRRGQPRRPVDVAGAWRTGSGL